MVLTQEQKNALRCAYADLKGAKQAHDQGDSHLHDWDSHEETMHELIEAFPELQLDT